MPALAHDRASMTIRFARPSDAPAIAQLCAQLGYSATEEQIGQRLTSLPTENEHALFVAQRPGGPLLGWVHVYRCTLVPTDPEAQLGGLLVDAAARRCGTGQRLLQAAERWARQQQCRAMYLRAHVTGADAHQFSARMGYAQVDSLVLRKRLLARRSLKMEESAP
jgi:N-acetylglutamate synthase-like GNAT family acetyltransferase